MDVCKLRGRFSQILASDKWLWLARVIVRLSMNTQSTTLQIFTFFHCLLDAETNQSSCIKEICHKKSAAM